MNGEFYRTDLNRCTSLCTAVSSKITRNIVAINQTPKKSSCDLACLDESFKVLEGIKKPNLELNQSKLDKDIKYFKYIAEALDEADKAMKEYIGFKFND